MGIDLSLVITRSQRPSLARRSEDRGLAWQRAFVPLAWSALFDPEDVMPLGRGARAPATLFCRVADALARLRARGPVLDRHLPARESAALAALEAGLAAAAPTDHVQLRLHELVSSSSDLSGLRAMVESTRAPALTGWTAALSWAGMHTDGARIWMEHHGGDLEAACVGQVDGHRPPPRYDGPISTRDALLPRDERARRHGARVAPDGVAEAAAFALLEDRLILDARWLDELDELFRGALRLPPTLGEVARGMTLAADPRHASAAREVVERLLADVADPFAPVAGLTTEQAAAALAAVTVEPGVRGRLNRALRPRAEPLALAVRGAGHLRGSVPAGQLALLRWLEDGEGSPRREALPEAILACRLHALRHGPGHLSEHDPLAPPRPLMERPVTPWSWALGLRWTGETLRVATRAPEPPSAEERRRFAAVFVQGCVAAVDDVDGAQRPWLLARAAEPVADAILDAADRAVLRLALGDEDAVPAVIAAATAEPARTAVAVAALARVADRSEAVIEFLTAAAPRDMGAAAALASKCQGDRARLGLVVDALRDLGTRTAAASNAYFEGLVTVGEHEAFAAAVLAAVEALLVARAVPELRDRAGALLDGLRPVVVDDVTLTAVHTRLTAS